jgi:hypothetical protein
MCSEPHIGMRVRAHKRRTDTQNLKLDAMCIHSVDTTVLSTTALAMCQRCGSGLCVLVLRTGSDGAPQDAAKSFWHHLSSCQTLRAGNCCCCCCRELLLCPFVHYYCCCCCVRLVASWSTIVPRWATGLLTSALLTGGRSWRMHQQRPGRTSCTHRYVDLLQQGRYGRVWLAENAHDRQAAVISTKAAK